METTDWVVGGLVLAIVGFLPFCLLMSSPRLIRWRREVQERERSLYTGGTAVQWYLALRRAGRCSYCGRMRSQAASCVSCGAGR